MCDFVGLRPDSVKEQISEWSSADSNFLDMESHHKDVLVVLDNTGWLQQISNGIGREQY